MVDIEMESNSILQGKEGRHWLKVYWRATIYPSEKDVGRKYTGEQFHPAEKKKNVS